MRILIPNSFCFAAIGIVKTMKRLSAYDTFFIGTGEEPYGLASGSTLVDKYIQSPMLNDKENYKNFLINTIKTNNIDLIICVLDSDLLILNEIINNTFNKAPTYVNPGFTIINTFSDKLLASKEIFKLGIKIPRIILENANCSVICRKKRSVGSAGIKIINPNEISNFGKENSFLQEYITGDEYTVDVLSDKLGVPHLIIPRKRLEIRNGMSFKTQVVFEKSLIESTKLICEKFKIPGLWNVQYLKNNGDLYFVELNPRFAGSAVAGIAASFNYLDLYIEHFVYNRPIPQMEELMKHVAWDSIITRYYEESVSSNNTSNVQYVK